MGNSIFRSYWPLMSAILLRAWTSAEQEFVNGVKPNCGVRIFGDEFLEYDRC